MAEETGVWSDCIVFCTTDSGNPLGQQFAEEREEEDEGVAGETSGEEK